MPFDAAHYDPWPSGHPAPPRSAWLKAIKEMVFVAAALLVALTLASDFAAAIDGFPASPDSIPPPPEYPPAFLAAQIAANATFFGVCAGAVWWRIRRFTADLST